MLQPRCSSSQPLSPSPHGGDSHLSEVQAHLAEQRRLAAARRTHDGHKVASGYFQAGAVYEIYGLTIFLDGEANVFQFEHWLRSLGLTESS